MLRCNTLNRLSLLWVGLFEYLVINKNLCSIVKKSAEVLLLFSLTFCTSFSLFSLLFFLFFTGSATGKKIDNNEIYVLDQFACITRNDCDTVFRE